MAKHSSQQQKKSGVAGSGSARKHHRLKKLIKLAALAGAAYGAKKLWEKQKRGGSTGAR